MAKQMWWDRFLKLEAVDSFLRNFGLQAVGVAMLNAALGWLQSVPAVVWIATTLVSLCAVIALIEYRKWRTTAKKPAGPPPLEGLDLGPDEPVFLMAPHREMPPDQEGVADGYKRVCVFFSITCSEKISLERVRFDAEIYDSSGQIVHSERMYEGDMNPGVVEVGTPLELLVSENGQEKSYRCDDSQEFRDLEHHDHLEMFIRGSARLVPEVSMTYYIRSARPDERVIVEDELRPNPKQFRLI